MSKNLYMGMFYVLGLLFLFGESGDTVIFAADGVAGVESSSSQVQAQKKLPIKAKLKKMNSLPNLMLKPQDSAGLTSEDRENAIIEAMKAQGVDLSDFQDPRNNKDITDNDVLVVMYDLVNRLGLKEVKLKDGQQAGASGEKVYMIDISWPNIRNWVLSCDDLSDDVKKVLDLLDKFEMDPEDRTKIRLKQEFNQAKELESLVDACIGSEGLFDISKLKKQRQDIFKALLKASLSNSAGFQKIASALVVIKKLNKKPFEVISHPKNVYYSIEIAYRLSQTKEEPKRIFLKLDDASIITSHYLVHELSHAFHSILCSGLFWILKNNKNMPIVTRSILNSKTFDLGAIFFPYFSEKRMASMIAGIEEHIQKHQVNKEKAALLLKDLVKWGFGSLILTDADLKNKSAIDIYSPKIMARAIYIAAQTQIDLNYETLWNNGVEILAITGMVPIKVGDKMFLISDRNNEIIFNKRKMTADALNKEYRQEKEFGKYRTHVSISGQPVEQWINKRIFDYIKVLYEGCEMSLCLLCGTSKDILEAQQPEHMLHVNTEDITWVTEDVDRKRFDSILEVDNIFSIYKGVSDIIESSQSSAEERQTRLDAYFSQHTEDIKRFGDTLVRIAIEKGDEANLKAVTKAINKSGKYDIKAFNGNSILFFALDDPNLFDELLSGGVDPNGTYIFNDEDMPLIRFAIEIGNLEVVEKFLDNGIKADSKVSNLKQPLLYFAINQGKPSIVESLLKHGADAKEKYRYETDMGITQESPLLKLAIEKGNVEIVEKLVKAIEEKGEAYKVLDPLHSFLSDAIKTGRPSIVELLLNHGADNDLGDRQQLLKLAIERKSLEIVGILLKHGSDNDLGDRQQLLKLAIERKSPEIVDILLKHGANANVSYMKEDHMGNWRSSSFFHYVVEQGNAEIVQKFLDNGVVDLARDYTALKLAVEKESKKDIAIKLLKAIEKPTGWKAEQYYLLIKSILTYDRVTTQRLLDEGANADGGNIYLEETCYPLLFAIDDSLSFDYIDTLLKAGADVNGKYKDEDGKDQPILKLAIEKYWHIKDLLEAGADAKVTYEDKEGKKQSLLKLAIEKGKNKIVAELLKAGADAKGMYEDKEGKKQSLLKLAIEDRKNMIVAELLKAGADAKGTYEDEARKVQPLLKLAIAKKNAFMIKNLLEVGADAKGTYKDGDKEYPLLHFAKQQGNEAIVQLLVAYGAKE